MDKRNLKERIFGLGTILDADNIAGGDECFEAAEKLQDISDSLGEGFHTMFRKAMDCPEAVKAWDAIQAIPHEEWDRGIRWLRAAWELPDRSE